MDHLLQDLKVALRVLLRRPGFTVVAVLTLALGTGATTAMFSVLHGVLLRPLPYSDADRLLALWQTSRRQPGPSVGGSVSHLNFLDWRRQSRTIGTMALYSPANFTVSGLGDAEIVPGAVVTDGFFEVFGAPPVMGRAFTAEDDLPASEPYVIVGHGFWKDRLGGDPNVLERSVEISGRPRRILGIAPAGFEFPRQARLWMAVRNDDQACGRACVFLNGVARLAPGAGAEEAAREMATVARRLEDAFPNDNTDVTAGVSTLRDLLVGRVRPALMALFGAVALVLLIVCANVANLLLVRGGARQAEIAVRAALGASRGRLLRQLLTESLVLAVGGALGGVVLAHWTVGLLKRLAPPGFPRLDEVGLDGTALTFAAGLALLTTVLFGLGPAFQLARLPLVDSLRQGRGEIGASGRRRGRSTLLVAEVSLSLVLLAAAGLMMRSFAEIQAIRPGFDADGVSTFTLSLPAVRYPQPDAVRRAHEEIDERLRVLPGVESVGRIRGLPLGTGEDAFAFTRPDQPPPSPGRAPVAIYRIVDADYFRTMRIPVLAGRPFTEADRDGALPVLVVSRKAAERFWPGEDPIGKAALIQKGPGVTRTVVGVVADVRSGGLTLEPQPEFYVPHAQDPSNTITYVVRSGLGTGPFLAAARQVVQGFDPKLPLIWPGSMRERLDDASAQPRFSLVLIGVFAAVGLVLAAVGMYGVVSYLVGQRTREIGVRMALGARSREVVGLVLWQGLRPAIAGVAVGLAATLAGGRLVASLLYGVRPHDPSTLAGVVVLLLAIIVAACLVPARRATRIPPSIALRAE